jgi:hypothetical protein
MIAMALTLIGRLATCFDMVQTTPLQSIENYYTVINVPPLSVVERQERHLDSLGLRQMHAGPGCLRVNVLNKPSSGQSNTMPTRIA